MQRAYVLLIAALLLSAATLHAQPRRLTALDSTALARATSMALDSVGADAVLVAMRTTTLDASSGEAITWSYTFYSGANAMRRAITVEHMGGAIYRRVLHMPTPQSSYESPVDTSDQFADSDVMMARLREDTVYSGYRGRHPSSRIAFASLDKYRHSQVPRPFEFPEYTGVWQVELGRIGDSALTCIVDPKSGATFCTTYFDTTGEYMVKRSVRSALEFAATNYGPFAHAVTTTDAGLIYPRGSGKGYLFGAGLWFGAEIPGVSTQVTKTYDPNSGFSMMTPGAEQGTYPAQSHPELFHSELHDITTGARVAADDELRWPLWMPAGANPDLMHPGGYIARDVDRTGNAEMRPAFIPGMEQFTSRYRDSDPTRFPWQMDPLGLQIEENVFAPTEGPYGMSVIVQYRIINRSRSPLFNCVVGAVADHDIGQSANDYARFYATPALRTAIAMSSPEQSGGFGSLAMTQLEAPLTASSGFVSNYKRVLYREEGRVATWRTWSMPDDPAGITETYEFMTSERIDGTSDVEDGRMLMTSDRFNMQPGDTAWYAVAYTVLPDRVSVPDGDVGLESYLKGLIDLYYVSAPSGIESAGAGSALSLAAYPNPSSGQVTYSLDVPVGGASLEIIDAVGRVITREQLDAGRHVQTIELPAGVYLMRAVDGGVLASTRVVVR